MLNHNRGIRTNVTKIQVVFTFNLALEEAYFYYRTFVQLFHFVKATCNLLLNDAILENFLHRLLLVLNYISEA